MIVYPAGSPPQSGPLLDSTPALGCGLKKAAVGGRACFKTSAARSRRFALSPLLPGRGRRSPDDGQPQILLNCFES